MKPQVVNAGSDLNEHNGSEGR